MKYIGLLEEGIRELGLEAEHSQLEDFISYKEILKEWNKKMNITAIREDEEIISKHFLDSLSLYSLDIFQGRKKIIDIGTGGGFPGLPLKIINRDLSMVLLDSLNKRIRFLKEIIRALALEDIVAIHGRAEEEARKSQHREGYDIAVSRAVASLDTLSEYCLPFVKLGGYFLAMKGPEVSQELDQAQRAIKILGGRLEQVEKIRIPGTDIIHSLILIKKIRPTGDKYPRSGGKARTEAL